MELDARIEAVLFHKSEPVSVKKLTELLQVGETEIQEALQILGNRLATSGIRLMRIEDEVALGTAPEASELIETIVKEELNRDLGKVGLETLSIILYQGPVSRSQIDYIRGVNSAAIVRNLLVRGLIERIPNPNDSRSFLYKPTFELLQHLGISTLEELPELESIRAHLAEISQETVQ